MSKELNLFNMMKEKGLEVPESVEDKKPTNSKKGKKAEPKKKEPEKYHLPLAIFYSGFEHQIRTEEYPEKKFLLEEDLLKHLRENFGYRILTKKRTSLEYDKEEREVIVHLKNPSKGWTDSFRKRIDSFTAMFLSKLAEPGEDSNLKPKKYGSFNPFHKGISLYPFKGGKFRWVKCDEYGYLIGPQDDYHNEPLSLLGEPGVYLKKRVPSSILFSILDKFMRVFPNEILAQVYYNKSSNEFILHWPEQKTGANFVQREKENFFLNNDKNIVLFLEIHSHAAYPASFSGIDDRNELDFFVYGVIGELNTKKPSYQFRIGFNGYFLSVPIEDIFDIEEVL